MPFYVMVACFPTDGDDAPIYTLIEAVMSSHPNERSLFPFPDNYCITLISFRQKSDAYKFVAAVSMAFDSATFPWLATASPSGYLVDCNGAGLSRVACQQVVG